MSRMLHLSNTVVQTGLKRQLDDLMADIKRLSASVQQKLKGFVTIFVQLLICVVYILAPNCDTESLPSTLSRILMSPECCHNSRLIM